MSSVLRFNFVRVGDPDASGCLSNVVVQAGRAHSCAAIGDLAG